MDYDRMVSIYLKMRDKRSELKRAFEAQDAQIKEQMEKIELALLSVLNSTNAENIKTESGTIYKSLDIMPSAADWSAFYAWVKEHDAFDALEKRVKKTFIADYMKDNENELPPGISVVKKYAVHVRRS